MSEPQINESNEGRGADPEKKPPGSSARSSAVPNDDWFIREYPFRANYLSLRFDRMHYIDEGEGDEIVLMVHGNPTWSFLYRNLVRAASPEIRCVAPDHIGMGFSSKPANYPYRLERHIDNLGSLVDFLRPEKVHLVVHDWGGPIGLGWALRNLDRVGRIVVMNTAAFPDARLPRRIAVCRIPYLGALLVKGLNAFAGPAARMAVNRRPLSREARNGFLLPYDHWVNRVGVYGFVRDIPMSDNHPTWPLIREIGEGLPALRQKGVMLAWGGADFCFSDHFYDRWRAALPSAATFHVPDAGHYLLEDAGEELIPAIRNFLLSDR